VKPSRIIPIVACLSLSLTGFQVSGVTHYVDLNCTNPISPYTNWVTAATNIQDAVDVTTTGDTVLVTNGVYATGGRKWFDSGTNRVTVTNAITLQSVNGPAVTLIQGGGQAGTTNAQRCVLVGANAVLSGFTLSNGRGGTGNFPDGGGVWCAAASYVVSNCILSGNAARLGGGAFRGTLVNCLVSSNSASSSGGGSYEANLINCIVVKNSATNGGGLKGIYGATTAKNCLIVSNTASASGGAASEGNFVNCTIVGNAAGSSVGAVENSAALYNCIVYYNTAPVSPNGIGKFENICLEPPLPGGSGFTNEPQFVNRAAGDYRLSSNSPCINSGRNAFITNTTDLDGNPRFVVGTVDIGAYEFQSPSSAISYFWLQQYGFPINALTDSGDADNDGADNYEEWFARTVPTNAASVLLMTTVSNSVSGATVSWQNISGVYYYLQRSTNLADTPPFVIVRSNILGNSFNDTNAVGGGPFFYRVGVQP
jgi:hypothetical protein